MDPLAVGVNSRPSPRTLFVYKSLDAEMDHTEIPIIDTDESLFDVLPKLFK